MDAANEGLHLRIDIMASENTDFIRIDGVSHTFQTATGNLPVLDDLNLNVPKNGFTAIVGPRMRKSTVTRLIAGLLRPNIEVST